MVKVNERRYHWRAFGAIIRKPLSVWAKLSICDTARVKSERAQADTSPITRVPPPPCPIRVGGSLQYQMRLRDTTVGLSLAP